MKRASIMMAALVTLCMACDNFKNVKETPKGLIYTVLRKGDGIAAKPGQFTVAYILFKDAKDSVWFDNRTAQYIEPVRIQDTTLIKKEEGIGEIFRYLTKGDSVRFEVPAAKLYEKTLRQPIPPNVDPKGNFSFTLGIKEIINEEQFIKERKAQIEKNKVKAAKEAAQHLAKDSVSIDSLIHAKNLIALKSKSGVRYVITRPGVGPNAVKGDKVSAMYAGYTIDGKLFDTNVEEVGKANGLQKPGYTPMEVNVGAARVIPGLDEAFLYMNKGTKATIYIPSSLAYGAERAGKDIPPYSVLIFDIELLNITTKK